MTTPDVRMIPNEYYSRRRETLFRWSQTPGNRISLHNDATPHNLTISKGLPKYVSSIVDKRYYTSNTTPEVVIEKTRTMLL
jgi:hypothetical protein